MGNVDRPGPVVNPAGGFLGIVGLVLAALFIWNVAIPFVEKTLNIGGHGDPPVPWSVPLPCVVVIPQENTTDTTCQKRYIRSLDLERSFTGSNGSFYADEFLALSRTPVIVIFPKQETAAERQKFESTMKAAVAAMGEWKRNVNTGQFASDEVRQVVKDAIAEADEIDQPVDETPEEQLRRLNLGPSILKLARNIRN